MRRFRVAAPLVAGLLGLLGLLAASGCGSSPSANNAAATPSGGQSSSVANQVAVSVNDGPQSDYLNGVFTSVTVCAPGSSQCQTIPNVLVDTGSEGLRIPAGVLTVALPTVTDTGGNALGECLQFEDAYTWGAVESADVKLAGETAAGIAVQVLAPNGFAAAPSACSSSGLPAQNTATALGANGIIGVGLFSNDCGPACAGAPAPAVYFDCPSSGCTATTVAQTRQVQNPVSSFASDNNGLVITLPAVGATGAPSVSGTLSFGVATQSDNAPGTVTVLTANDYGYVTAAYKGSSYSSILDTGSNGFFALDATTLGIPTCPSPNQVWYCPATPTPFSFQTSGANGASVAVTMSIQNAQTLFQSDNSVFNNLAGPSSQFVDYGVPFFLGRTVYLCFAGATAPGGACPWVAF